MTLVFSDCTIKRKAIQAIGRGFIRGNGGLVCIKDLSHVHRVRYQYISFSQNDIGATRTLGLIRQKWPDGLVKAFTPGVCITFAIKIRLDRNFLQLNHFISQFNIIFPGMFITFISEIFISPLISLVYRFAQLRVHVRDLFISNPLRF